MLKSDPRNQRGLAEVTELEDRIEKLKQSFELFFSGVDNIDPTDKKMPIRRIITRLNEMHVKNPAIRFKFQSLVGRFVSLNQYWERTMKAIEEGRISRGYFRQPLRKGADAQAYYGKEAPVLPDASEISMSELLGVGTAQEKERAKRSDIRPQNIDDSDLANPEKLKFKRPLDGPEEGVKRRDARTPAPQPTTQKPPIVNAEMDGKQVDRIYSEFVSARQNAAEPAAVSRDTMAKQLNKQYDLLRRKYQGADIDFKVVTQDGKVVVKPIIKKS